MRNSIQTFRFILPAVLAAFLLHSCGKSDKPEDDSLRIILGASSVKDTKAAIGSLDDLKNSHQGFGVFGYKTRTANQTFTFTRLFDNTSVEYDSDDQIWTYSPTRYWDSNPENISYQFLAYWPHLAATSANQNDPDAPWVTAVDVNNLTSREDMSYTLHNIANWQDVAQSDTKDFLTSAKFGYYRTNTGETEVFGNRTVIFDFDHILSKLIVKAYYEGVLDNHVTIYNVTLSGQEILLPGGSSDYEKTLSSLTSGFQTIQKGAAAQTVSQVLYNDANGCQIQEDAFKENAQDDDYIPTPVCEWLTVPTDGWTGLTMSVSYSVGSSSAQTSDIANVSIGVENVNEMEAGKSYMLIFKFNTQGGIELETMWINGWNDAYLNREVYNW